MATWRQKSEAQEEHAPTSKPNIARSASIDRDLHPHSGEIDRISRHHSPSTSSSISTFFQISSTICSDLHTYISSPFSLVQTSTTKRVTGPTTKCMASALQTQKETPWEQARLFGSSTHHLHSGRLKDVWVWVEYCLPYPCNQSYFEQNSKRGGYIIYQFKWLERRWSFWSFPTSWLAHWNARYIIHFGCIDA